MPKPQKTLPGYSAQNAQYLDYNLANSTLLFMTLTGPVVAWVILLSWVRLQWIFQ